MKNYFYNFKIVSFLQRLSLLVGILLGFSIMDLSGQETTNYTVDDSFIVPAHVTGITVEAWGGGGGSYSPSVTSSAGGGGGAYAKSTFAVLPGSSFIVDVGQKGSIGNSGGASIFGLNLVVAAGGASDITGGEGGQVLNSIGDIIFSGGDGADVNVNSGGGGGSSAGTAVNGNNGSGTTGGAAPAGGGKGGNGSASGSGQNGSFPGGGGGGKSIGNVALSSSGEGATGTIVISYPTLEISSQDCECNNDQTPNQNNGTYNTTLVIKNSDDSQIPGNLIFTFTSSSGITDLGGGLLDGMTFIYCNGGGCAPGVTIGQYYRRVKVNSSGIYSAQVDGPDAGTGADITLGSTSCSINYPALPTIPIPTLGCLTGVTIYNSDASTYASGNSLVNITLPDGFSQTGTGDLSVDPDLLNPGENSPLNEIYLIKENMDGCRVASHKEFRLFPPVNPALDDKQVDCRTPRIKNGVFRDSIWLYDMLNVNNTQGGNFFVGGSLVENDSIILTGPVCIDVTYSIVDSCGTVFSDTKALQVNYKPVPAFDFAAADPKSPSCATASVVLNIEKSSSGLNPSFTVTANKAGYAPTISGNQVTLPNPTSINEDVTYNICLTETNNAAASCGGLALPTPCTETVCKKFTLYRDPSDCGANALFTNECEAYEPDYCPVSDTPGLEIGCKFITFTTPDILTSDVNIDQAVAYCNGEDITGDYNVSFFGVNTGVGIGSKKLESFPGMSTVCGIFNFKILGWRPLGALYNLLGCDKTIAQFLLGLLSNMAGGDGGGYIVMADTDGDGAFDFLIDDGYFPSGTGDFEVPNRVKGEGFIAVRAVGGYINSPSNICGNLDIEGVDLLELLPIGAIPVVGAVVEDVIAAAGCGVEIALSVQSTEKVKVVNSSTPTFINCVENDFVFAQTLDCNIPVSWSIPVAYDACSDENITYVGVTALVTGAPSFAYYTGNNPPTAVTINGPGVYQTTGPVSGSVLPPGVYPVTYTAVSCNGNPELCTFNVVVTSGDPILECPNSVTIPTELDGCTAVVNGLAPYQGIGCASIINYAYTTPVTSTVVSTSSTLIGTHNIPDGHIFELGTTTIEYTMLVDINGDSDYGDPNETQTCSFDVIVEDRQLPDAICIDVDIQLNDAGAGTVYAAEIADEIYVDGGSNDNCTSPLTLLLSQDNMTYYPSLDFDCQDIGQNVVNLQVRDGSGNLSYCKAVINVIDFFEGFVLDLDVPEVCFEPFQNSYDFSPYLVIASPDGTNIAHANVNNIGPDVQGAFGISAFLPDPGSTDDPGTMSTDGVYTIGSGTGYITISYILSIDEQVNQIDDTSPLTGCYRMVHDVFRIEKLDPIWEGGFMCCDESPVWLGGANWDGIGLPTIPAGMLGLTDIRGNYPGDVYGEWTGEGVSFVDTDGMPYSGDEYYMFDPTDLDGTYTIIYTIGDEPCIFTYAQDILVTCQDLHVEISDQLVCPANFVEEKEVFVNLDDNDLVVSTTGFAALAADGAHYGNGPTLDPVQDLVDVPVVDGRVVIPAFYAPAVRDVDYEICVTTYQTTPFGCADVFCYTITVQDLEAPEFQNCPKEPVVVDAPSGWCQSFVNFEYPWALDNCMHENAKIEQVDLTGLVSGDLFPVGLTMLAFTATDTVGNQSYCELKIIVNDYDRAPKIACTTDKEQVNDQDKCGAEVFGIEPLWTTDNCPDNNTILYEITDDQGNPLYCGFEDASGEFFPVGTSTVEYKIFDQPLVLITEVVQNGMTSGVEVTNFGPAAIDLTCGTFRLKDDNGIVVEEFMVPTRNNKSTYGTTPIYPPDPVVWQLPNPNIVPVGGTFTHVFTNTPPVGQEMMYSFEFLERLIDETVINGDVEGEVILRKNVCDHDAQSDFIPATPCDPGSFDLLNPGLPTMTDNGTLTALQNFAPSVDDCSFDVIITDLETPTCVKHDSILIANTFVPATLNANQCLISEITMPAGLVHDVNIHDLNISVPDAGAVTVYLNSPAGTRIKLFDQVCDGQANIDVNLDNTIIWTPAPEVINALCNPLGQGGTYSPEESFKAFYGEEAGGIWTLQIFTSDNVSGSLNSWDLQVLYQLPYDQQDVVLQNIPEQCDTVFTWIHPIFEDNCIEGYVDVVYTFENTVTNVYTTDTLVLSNTNGTINEQGLTITRVFAVGVTTIEYLLVDQYGNYSACSFTVTVEDNEKPEFLAPYCYDRMIQLYPTECYGELINPPDAEDNCEMEGVTFYYEDYTPADILNLPIGVYNLIAQAKDIYGNIQECIFQVSVVEFIPLSSVLACNDHINLSLDNDCEAVINPDMILEGDLYRCYDNYCIEITDDLGNPHDNFFDYTDVGQTFTIGITDCEEFGNNCWGLLTIMEKLIPEIECPDDVVVTCNADTEPASLGIVEILNCEPFATIDYEDEFNDYGNCGEPRAEIIRTWIVDDNQGNVVSCDQIITIKKFDLDDIEFPADILTLECDLVSANPELTEPANTGFPSIDGVSVEEDLGFCMLSYLWNDEVYHYCGSSYEILRTWKVRDMCGQVSDDNPYVHVQTIKVFDTQSPVIHNCEDIVVSTNAYSCDGSIFIPVPQIIDNCNEVSLQIVMNGVAVDVEGNYADGNMTMFANNMQLGDHEARFIARDDCGNLETCYFTLTVVDNIVPIAVCEQHKQVGLTIDGEAKIAAVDFDSGSFDNCKDVFFKVKRLDGGCDDLNANDKFDDWVHYCCEDLNSSEPVMTQLRIYEIDPGPGPVNPSREAIGGDLYGHYNDCMTTVTVESKVTPQIICEDKYINCEDNIDPYANPGLGEPFVYTSCGFYSLEYSDNLSGMDDCGVGQIVRTWTVFEGGENKGSCTQKIYVEASTPFDPTTIVFPNLTSTSCMVDLNAFGMPTFETNPCNVVTAEVVDVDTFTFVDDACYKIYREWVVIDWCVYEANSGAEGNVDGFIFISGGKRAKLSPNNFINDGYYKFIETLMVYDETAPVVTVEDQCFGVTTCVTSPSEFKLNALATEEENDCGGIYDWKYVIHDINTWEVIQYSKNNEEYKGQNYVGGVEGASSKDKLFDVEESELTILPSLTIGNFRVTWTANDGCGNTTQAYQYFEIADKKAPTPFLVDISTAYMQNCMIEIWAISFDKGACDGNCLASIDNCSDQLYFTFNDVLPLIDQSWSLDNFGLFYFNPATGAKSSREKYMFGEAYSWDPVRNTAGQVIGVDRDGNAPETFYEISVYVWDQFKLNGDCDDNNYDFATIQLNVNNEGDDCGETSPFALISGSMKSRDNNFYVNGVTVSLDSDSPEYPKETLAEGIYTFDNVGHGEYELEANKYDEHGSGVSTLDLIIIQRHLLGMKAMDDVHDIIASDANESGSISAADLLELRKLILSVSQELPNGRSWRFIDKNYQFENPASPWSEMQNAEILNLTVTGNMSDVDFTGIKLGDVNGSVQSNLDGLNLDQRSENKIGLIYNEVNVEAGSLIELPVYSSEFKNVFGMQFTLRTGDLELISIESGKMKVNANNIGRIDKNLITFSWSDPYGLSSGKDEVLFTIKLKADKQTAMGGQLTISSDLTRSEIYTGQNFLVNDLDLRSASDEHLVFELYQNVPNPFTNKTEIQFTMTEEGPYEIVIYDIAGKTLEVINGEGKKSINTVILDGKRLPPGVLYYKLNTSKESANKKMLLIK